MHIGPLKHQTVLRYICSGGDGGCKGKIEWAWSRAEVTEWRSGPVKWNLNARAGACFRARRWDCRPVLPPVTVREQSGESARSSRALPQSRIHRLPIARYIQTSRNYSTLQRVDIEGEDHGGAGRGREWYVRVGGRAAPSLTTREPQRASPQNQPAAETGSGLWLRRRH